MHRLDDSVSVSVIIPFFNAGPFLNDALESINQQSFQDYEVILVDDGSNDGSSDIAKAMTSKDRRYFYIRQENQGAGSARNRGMSLAKGKYLLFLDADDLFEPCLLENLYAAAEEADVDIAICRADCFESKTGAFLRRYDAGKPRFSAGKQLNADYSDTMFQRFTYVPWDKLFNAEFIKANELEFQNLAYSNDNYFVLSAIAEAESVFFLDDVLIHHRIGTGGSLRDNMEKNPLCDLLAFAAIHNRLTSRGELDDGRLASFREACASLSFNTALRLASSDTQALRVFCEKLFSEYDVTWGTNCLTYRDVLLRQHLWKYKRMRGSSVAGFSWVCKTRNADRAVDMKRNKFDKAIFAVRLILASFFTKGMAKTYGNRKEHARA